MEIRILTFLAFVCVAVVGNAFIAVGVYVFFNKLTTKLDSTLSEFESNSETRQWLESMKTAAEQAVTVTQTTKEWLAEIAPMMAKAQENYTRTMAEADIKLAEVAKTINTTADQIQEAVEGPAASVLAFTSGVTKAVETMRGGGE